MSDARADRLQARVATLAQALDAMRERLAEEREALRGRADAATLEALANEKHAVVEQITVLYDGLREELAGYGAGDGNAGSAIAALRRSHPELAAHVNRLVGLIRECQQANQDNGVMVSAGLRSANSALDTLQGGPSSTPADTYDTQGRTRRGGGSDFLALRA